MLHPVLYRFGKSVCRARRDYVSSAESTSPSRYSDPQQSTAPCAPARAFARRTPSAMEEHAVTGFPKARSPSASVCASSARGYRA